MCKAFIAVIFAVVMHSKLAHASPVIWIESSLTKVRPTASPGSVTAVTLSGGRNEFLAAQIVVRDTAEIFQVRATMSALTGPATIPADNGRFYLVHRIALTQPSDASGSTGQWPDALIPQVDDLDGSPRNAFPFDAAANDARAIWLELLVSPDALAGDYKGSVVLTWSPSTGVTQSQTVPVALHVYDFTLPSTPTLKSYYQLDDQNVCKGHYAGDSGCGDGYGPARNALIDRYVRVALDHRITLGGGTYGLYPRKSTGVAAWAPFDSQYGPILDGTAATRLKGARATSIAGWHLPEMAAVPAVDMSAHFASKGWLDRAFYYVADEPGTPNGDPWSVIVPTAQSLGQWVPSMRRLVTCTPADARANHVDASIDIYVPVVNYVDDAMASGFADKSHFWIYDSCMSSSCGSTTALVPNWPSSAIDHTGARNAALPWAAYRYGATGILYWQTVKAYGDGDAWTAQWWSTQNGDGNYFYPGTPAKIGGTSHSPVVSQRLKLLRQGVQAYEYLAMVAKAGDPEFAIAQAKLVAPTGSGFDPGSADRMGAARNALAARLEVLLHSTPTPTPPPSTSSIWGILTALAAAGVTGAAALLAFKPKN